jgi:hypothetical protein
MTRRDMCHFTGKRAGMLNAAAASAAWGYMAEKVERMGDMDVPKFLDLLRAFRTSTIQGIQDARSVGAIGLVCFPEGPEPEYFI